MCGFIVRQLYHKHVKIVLDITLMIVEYNHIVKCLRHRVMIYKITVIYGKGQSDARENHPNPQA